jgi:hypothetical protein
MLIVQSNPSESKRVRSKEVYFFLHRVTLQSYTFSLKPQLEFS